MRIPTVTTTPFFRQSTQRSIQLQHKTSISVTHGDPSRPLLTLRTESIPRPVRSISRGARAAAEGLKNSPPARTRIDFYDAHAAPPPPRPSPPPPIRRCRCRGERRRGRRLFGQQITTCRCETGKKAAYCTDTCSGCYRNKGGSRWVRAGDAAGRKRRRRRKMWDACPSSSNRLCPQIRSPKSTFQVF